MGILFKGDPTPESESNSGKGVLIDESREATEVEERKLMARLIMTQEIKA